MNTAWKNYADQAQSALAYNELRNANTPRVLLRTKGLSPGNEIIPGR